MRGVRIDPRARTARVRAGAVWGDVTGPAAHYGLAPLAGSSATVGVVGYTLGGGLGWLGRAHGFACNSVTAVELVTADGEHVRTDATTRPSCSGRCAAATSARSASSPRSSSSSTPSGSCTAAR